MVEIYDEINKSELLIFASPIYFWGVTGIMKTFIDRLYFYYSPFNKKLIAGKKAIIISPMNMNSDIHKLKIVIKFYDFLFDNLDIELVDTYFFGNINEKGEIGTNSEYLRQIDYLGKNLIEYFKKTESL
jgi:multimeric flavodoxin WrbA